MSLDQNGDLVADFDPWLEELLRPDEDPLERETRVCKLCGKDLIDLPLSTEGGLQPRWGCPLHGTRGVT